jgi:hypothetical protein
MIGCYDFTSTATDHAPDWAMEPATISVQSSPGERRIAVSHGGVLTDYAIWRPGAPDGLGDVHHARVIATVPAMAGSFLALDGAEAFLPDSETPAPVKMGDYLTVRITRASQAGKGPRVTARGTAPVQDGKPRLLQTGPSPLDRLARAWPDAGIVVEDTGLFAALRPAYEARLTLSRPAFDPALESDIDALGDTDVALPGGMRAHIALTPALTAIDVDGGAATAARGEKSRAQRDANLAAIPALARQIRLRNLSGGILIDFAGMPAKRRQVLAPALDAALRDDPLHPRLLGFTQLGFAEILRPRLSPPLAELLGGAHAAGLRALRQAAMLCAQRSATLRAPPAIIAALADDKAALAELAAGTTHPLMLKSDPSLPAGTWNLDQTRA